jgi:hypothetical protein
VKETEAELAELQRLLDASIAGSGEHLTGIIDANRRLNAGQLVTELRGMKVLVVATVTAAGEPRTSCADGHFLHGRWMFSTAVAARKAQHLLARPAVSATYVDGERMAVFTHGHVSAYLEGPEFDGFRAYFADYYGADPTGLAEQLVFFTINPTWMVAYAGDPAAFPSS